MKKSNSVEICFFGQLKIITPYGSVSEENIKSDKITKLLSYLILNRGTVVSVDVLSTIIWPQGVDEPYASLRALVFRTRKLLADIFPERDFIVANGGSYKVNSYYKLNVDSDYLTERMNIFSSEKGNINILDTDIDFILRKSDPFLEKLSYDTWGLPVTTYYNSKMLSFIHTVVKALFNEKLYDSVVELATKGLVIDPLAENLHTIIIETLLAQGYKKLAINHYNNALAMFQNEYNIKPTKEFSNIFSRLTYTDTTDRGD